MAAESSSVVSEWTGASGHGTIPTFDGLLHPGGRLAKGLDIAALYRRYGDMVLARCRTLLGDEALAQDASQEVFLKMIRFHESFRGDSSPSTFLYKVATTTCLNRLRSRRRRPEDPFSEVPPVAYEDAMLAGVEVRQLVDVLLEGVDDRTRAILVYRFVDGMTHDEVGALLGISGAAVRKRVATFRQRLAAAPPAWLQEE